MMFLGEIIFKSIENWPIALGVGVIGIGAMIWSNARQVRRVGFFQRRALEIFRTIAVVAIGVSILRPAQVLSRRGEEGGRILAVMDESASMGMKDWSLLGEGPRGVKGQLLAIARAKGLLDEKSFPREILDADAGVVRLRAMAEEIKRARREEDYSRLMGRAAAGTRNLLDERIAAFLDEAKNGSERLADYSPTVSRAFSDLAGVHGDRDAWINRLDRNLSALVQAVNAMNHDFAGQWFKQDQMAADICYALAEYSRLDMAYDALAGPGGLVGRLDRKLALSIKPMGSDREEMELEEYAPMGVFPAPSALARSGISAEIARIEEKSSRAGIQAILLFTDGRETSATATVALRQANVPVFPIFCAGESPRDLAIQSCDIPAEMFVGEAREAKVNFRVFNMDARDVQGSARMSIDGARAAEIPLRFRFLDGEATFPISFSTPGVHRVALSIPAQEFEISTENNSVERLVKVFPRKPRVLAVEGEAKGEFTAFSELSQRIPWIEFKLVAGGETLMDSDPLWCDVAALFDPAPDALSDILWKAVLDAVKIRGAGLIMVPGDASTQRLVEEDPLAQAIPSRPWTQRIWKSFPGQRQAFHPVPAKDLPDSLLISLDPNPESSRNKWNALPGLSRRLWVGEPRPAARVLLVDRDSNDPMLLEMPLGAGKSFYLAFDESSRFKSSGGAYDAFWTRLIRVAMERPYAAYEAGWAFDLDKLAVEPGESVGARAKSESADPGVWPDSLKYQVYNENQPAAGESLRGDSAGRYSGVFSVSAPGLHTARLSLPEGGVIDIPVQVKNPADDEMKNLTGNRQYLVNLAETTGGKCLGLDEIGDLPRILENIRRRQIIRREIALWDSPWLFALILCCFAAEWSLRKHHGFS